MATTGDKSQSPSHRSEKVGAFTAIDLIHLLIRDGSISGCAVAGWRLGGWLGVVWSVPVGWLLGLALRYALVFVTAVILKLLFGGTIWKSDARTEAQSRPPDLC